MDYLVPRRVGARGGSMVLAAVLAGEFLWDSLRQLRRAARLRAVLRARFLDLGLTGAAEDGENSIDWVSRIAISIPSELFQGSKGP